MTAALGAIGRTVGNAAPTAGAQLPLRRGSYVSEQSHVDGTPQNGCYRVHEDRGQAQLTLATSACPTG